jgi:hypothetical protein
MPTQPPSRAILKTGHLNLYFIRFLTGIQLAQLAGALSPTVKYASQYKPARSWSGNMGNRPSRPSSWNTFSTG